jgi:hypothetical protein
MVCLHRTLKSPGSRKNALTFLSISDEIQMGAESLMSPQEVLVILLQFLSPFLR